MKDPILTEIMAAVDRDLPLQDAMEFNAFLRGAFAAHRAKPMKVRTGPPPIPVIRKEAAE
jgi:hypothetical protein